LWSPDALPEWRRTGRTPVVNQRTGQVLWLSTDILDDLDAHSRTTLDVLGAAAAVRAPWLIAHGSDDESVPVDAARQLSRAARPGTAELLEIAGTGHTFGVRHPWAGPTPAYERVTDATVAWLARHLA
ncbi:MAG: alpha/beta hydrolase family protein, partial [Gemmatimonadales bacterium]